MATNSMWGQPPRLTTDTSGNTVLVGADGTVYGLGTLGEFTLKRVAAFAVANNATNTYVSFDAVVENTTPFATLDLYDPTNPAMGDTAIFIPAGVTRIKFLANVGIPNTLSDGSTPLTAGSFRATIKQNQGTANLTPAVHVHYVPPATDITGHLAVVSGWMDCVAGDYFELSIRHVFGGTVNFGGGLALYLQAEFK